MKSINELLEKLPFSRGFLLVLLVIVLIVYKLSQPHIQERAAFGWWQLSLDQRKEKVAESIESLDIADENLLSCIRNSAADRASIHPANSGGIDDVRALRMLYCPASNIKTLSGIGELSALTFIDLSRNNIQSLAPLANHPSLKSLDMTDNPLNNLQAIKSLASLKQLYLPDMPEMPCLGIDSLVRGIKSNYSSLKCAGPRHDRAEVNTGLAGQTSDKANRLPDSSISDELTNAQKQELFEYEREMRYQK